MKYIYPGATHIHTLYSDGTGNIKEIAAAAKKAGLKWIIITDHNNLTGLKNSEEGWYEDVAVIIGEEISPENSDHYLALGIKDEINPDIGYEQYIKQTEEQGGIGFIAHPDESLSRKNDLKPLRWTNWDVKGFTGLEIWNYLSDLVDNYNPKNAVDWYFRRNNKLSGPTPKVLNWWDSLNNNTDSIVPAIGGVDLHALIYKYKGIKLKIFPYYPSFKTVSNVLYFDEELSGNFEEAKAQILTALKNGNNVVMNRAWNNGKGYPHFYAENLEKIRAYSGESIKFDNGIRIIAVVPKMKDIKMKIIHNGKYLLEANESNLQIDNLKPGKYRMEAYYKNRPWIFTNPIHIN